MALLLARFNVKPNEKAKLSNSKVIQLILFLTSEVSMEQQYPL